MTDAIAVSTAGDGERFDRSNRSVTIRVDLPGLSVHEIDFDPTFAVPQHAHDDHVDAFYVLEGEVEVVSGDRVIRAAAGTLVAVPPGVTHGFRTPGPGRARLLSLHAPDAGFSALVRGTREGA